MQLPSENASTRSGVHNGTLPSVATEAPETRCATILINDYGQ
eukprot:SAG25_NODE_11209_length_310_cov_5211.383886_1_plen_41_part_10